MNQVQDRSEKVFHNQDLVLWHARTLPIPAVVVCQEGNKVIIKARVEGYVKELEVSPHELVER